MEICFDDKLLWKTHINIVAKSPWNGNVTTLLEEEMAHTKISSQPGQQTSLPYVRTDKTTRHQSFFFAFLPAEISSGFWIFLDHFHHVHVDFDGHEPISEFLIFMYEAVEP